MKLLRLALVPGDQIEPGKQYLLAASAQPAPLPPGHVPEVGKPLPIQMNMAPCRLEFYDTTTGEIEEVEPELVDPNEPPPSPILMP